MTSEPGVSLTCPYCLKGIGNRQGLSRHTRAFHPQEPPPPLLTSSAPRFPHAACKGRTDLFYPPIGLGSTSAERRRMVVEARELCMTCPHRAPCAEYALANPNETYGGMWGGLSPDELAARRRDISAVTCPECGRHMATRYGLERHLRRAHQHDQEGTG